MYRMYGHRTVNQCVQRNGIFLVVRSPWPFPPTPNPQPDNGNISLFCSPNYYVCVVRE